MTTLVVNPDITVERLTAALDAAGLEIHFSYQGSLHIREKTGQGFDANNPYLSSPHFRPYGVWADSFARHGEVAWCVFQGTNLLARVENQRQAENIVALCRKGS